MMISNAHNPQLAAIEITDRLVDGWSSQLKILLETKHLYQKVEVPIPELLGTLIGAVNGGLQGHVRPAIEGWERRPLEAAMARSRENLQIVNQMASVTKPLLLVTNVKLFCKRCDSAEVFYPLWARDVTGECKDPRGNSMPGLDRFQLFFLAFQCQNCHSDPEGFIVRRVGYRLHLEGRSPIEQVVVPKYFPKQELHFFSDALVAFNAGKKLAGLFYLRTFLEQFARRVTGLRGRSTGDEIMDVYASTLPLAHRDHMPSLKSLYDKLSEALHSAREDEALFTEVKGEIDRHFDIRRVFNISETPPPTEQIEPDVDEQSLASAGEAV
jgi:hypothetical protein